VRLQPRASKNEIVGIIEGQFKVRVQAPPVGGAANRQCQELLARALGLSKSQVSLLRGTTSRDKVFLLSGISAADVLQSYQTMDLTSK
jgi:uncharacterized protein (TIGR00251 family)